MVGTNFGNCEHFVAYLIEGKFRKIGNDFKFCQSFFNQNTWLTILYSKCFP